MLTANIKQLQRVFHNDDVDVKAVLDREGVRPVGFGNIWLTETHLYDAAQAVAAILDYLAEREAEKTDATIDIANQEIRTAASQARQLAGRRCRLVETSEDPWK